MLFFCRNWKMHTGRNWKKERKCANPSQKCGNYILAFGNALTRFHLSKVCVVVLYAIIHILPVWHTCICSVGFDLWRLKHLELLYKMMHNNVGKWNWAKLEKKQRKRKIRKQKTQQFFDSENFQIPRTGSSLIPIFFSKYLKLTGEYYIFF